MSISPPGDILLDVVKAADPAMVETAQRRLKSAAAADAGGKFDALVKAPAILAGSSMPAKPPTDVATKFEGMVLQSFIETMLPKDSENTFGSGLSGDVWKSMLAEKIANVVAERGGIGIGNRILGDFVLDGDKKQSISGVQEVSNVVEQSRSDDMATSLVNKILRDFLSKFDAESSSNA